MLAWHWFSLCATHARTTLQPTATRCAGTTTEIRVTEPVEVVLPTGLIEASEASADDEGLSGGAVAGIVVGVLVAIVLVGVIVYVVATRDSMGDVPGFSKESSVPWPTSLSSYPFHLLCLPKPLFVYSLHSFHPLPSSLGSTPHHTHTHTHARARAHTPYLCCLLRSPVVSFRRRLAIGGRQH